MAATLSFCEALNGGIASGTLVDTKIILFSRRNSSGRVHGPKALYASSHVLKSVPYFDQREPATPRPDLPASNLTTLSYKFFLEPSQKLDHRISAIASTKMNPRMTMVTTLTATSKVMTTGQRWMS